MKALHTTQILKTCFTHIVTLKIAFKVTPINYSGVYGATPRPC